MEKQGLFRSIVNAVILEEKKKFTTKPRDLFFDQKKQRWYRLMNFIDNLEEGSSEAPSEPENT